LPARDIDSVEILSHLGDHDRVETTVSCAGSLVLDMGLVEIKVEDLSLEVDILQSVLQRSSRASWT